MFSFGQVRVVLNEGLLNSKKFGTKKVFSSDYYKLIRNPLTTSDRNKDIEALIDQSKNVSHEELEIESLTFEELEIEEKRNKSRLRPQHYNMLYNKPPYQEPMTDIHHTIQYKRRMFGRYGNQSNLNPGSLWPTRKELEESMEYEKVAHPFTLQELIERAQKKVDQEKKEIEERQLQIEKNLKQLDKWKADIAKKLAKKLADAAAAKAKKDALIEEVRRYFGYNVDPRDEKFKEMLAQKEKEEKKKQKEARAKAREQHFMSSLQYSDSSKPKSE